MSPLMDTANMPLGLGKPTPITPDSYTDLSHTQTNHFNIGSLMERGIRLIGNGQAPVHKYWGDLLDKIKTGELDPLQMVSHRYRIEDIDKVYYAFEKKQDGIQKVFIETKFSLPACEGSPKLSSI